ncbi:glycoside hydrolase family 61 protein [Chaetomium strumarium]|uniref:lytic cellulose monooxygenase (C4-dehydrogenating) n=1 Tax=Chaetomium strumarium TaxID=1170767 RepID=A0AAJ0GMF7_9PEZI|nr:glycoside hydrolase family 61 protein [Chaetomium strumarium]
MPPPPPSALTLLLLLTTLLTPLLPSLGLLPVASAHSHLAYIIIEGQLYHGFDPRPNQQQQQPAANPPSHVGWSTTAFDDGFVPPANYSTPDIICHVGGTAPPAHAPVRAGDRIHVQWNGWPVGHVGPVLSYLARCESETGCTGLMKGKGKEGLRWTKIDDSRPVMEVSVSGKGDTTDGGEGEGVPGQRWATDVLIASNNSWLVAVPRGLQTGAYVLRHEIIALHFAERENGAQNYPLCMNLFVQGDDEAGGAGFEMDDFDARGFYKADDPGILVNVTAGLQSTYVVPGPTVAVGASPVPYAQQSASVSRGVGTPVVVTRSTETVPFNEVATPTGASRLIRGYDRRY